MGVALLAWLTRELWSWPLPLLLAGTHLMLTVRLRGVQLRALRGVRLSLRPAGGGRGVGSFGALATSVGAALGAGNILGMGVAVAVGGPGAVFWFCVAGLLGMATQYAESRLALEARARDHRGESCGGPMEVLRQAGFPGAARLYALLGMLTAFGVGCALQGQAVAQALAPWGLPVEAVTLGLTALAGGVVLAGGTGVARACERLVPAMTLLYLGGCAGLLLLCRRQLGMAVWDILRGAAGLEGALGGSLGAAVRSGFARGLLAGEAGLGSGGIAAAAVKDVPPGRQALVSMSAGVWTTLLGGVTGLALTATGLRFPGLAAAGAEGYSVRAFALLPGGRGLLAVCLCIFSFTSILGWCYYGQVCAWSLRRRPGDVAWYKGLFLLALAFCFRLPAPAVWTLTDLLNGLLALPNLFGLWRLRKRISALPVDEPAGIEDNR